jgi:hypothetical protein
MMLDQAYVEKVAIILYTTDGGVAPDASEEEQINVLGKVREPWENLPEWQRDDYRFQATYVLNYLKLF